MSASEPKNETLCKIEEFQKKIMCLEKDLVDLKRDRRLFYSLLDGIPGFVFLRAPDYSIKIVNQYFREKFGEPQEKCCYEIISNRTVPCAECRLFEVIKTKKPQKWEWTNKINGRVYRIYDYPYIDADQQIFVLELGIDITELNNQILYLSEREQKISSIMAKQSKHASMGEMIGNIAHEWRQPLNLISLLIQDLEESYSEGNFSKEYLDETVHKVVNVLQYMSHTIDDFSNFFSPEKEMVSFSVQESLDRVLSFMGPELKHSNIRFKIKIPVDFSIHGYPNEYAHVLLNIIKNAKDVFVERKITDPKILIKGINRGAKSVVTITDNAGGILKDIIEKIFDPYFTTKGKESGIGIGLYLSKIIIENNMHGKLSVANTEDGAEFRIEI